MKTIKLSNSVVMPILGYGVYQVTKEECERCVLDALKAGYRSIDTAQSYFNEEEVGNAIVKSGIPREKIFLTTKIWIEHYGYEECKKSVEESLKKLKTDYLDLCLLHQPFADYYGAWRALEDLYEEGKIRAIGVSNFYLDRLIDLARFARIKPMVNQVETHPHNQQIVAKQYMDKYNIQIEAWAPFGEGRGGLFEDATLKTIGEKHNKSVAQVILRWHIQRGVVVIPKSTHYERMVENLNVFDFTLSEDDMSKITALDKNTSSFFSHSDPAMVEWFVKMVNERKEENHMKKILFINGSPNENGNTAMLAKTLLGDRDYEILNLVDYKIYSYGQKYSDDQFNEILEKMRNAEILIMGSPLYWHNICGAMRNLLDRFYGPVEQGAFNGKSLVFLF